MNHIHILTQKYAPNLSEIELDLSAQTEKVFQEKVFPVLFDGKTSGARTELTDGRVRYTLLVYDVTLVKLLKQALYNGMLKDNGQLN